MSKQLAVGVVCMQLAGCLALQLSSRGAPLDEWREYELVLGAVDLPVAAHQGDDHEATRVPPPLWTTVPFDAWFHGYETTLVDAAGETLPDAALHHFKVMSPDRRELFSPILLHLAGGGADTKPISLPRQAGVRVEQGDSLLITAMLHNPTDRPWEGVRLKITLHYSPLGPWEPPLAVVPFFTHVTPPMHEPSYDLPPGRSQRSLEITPAVSGWIIGLGGHMHQYGVALRLEDVASGRVLWENEPKRTSDGSILETPYDRFVWSRGPALVRGRTYRVTAIYDNPTGETIPDGGMGTVGGAFVTDEPWPEVDREAAEYVWYLAREVAGGGVEHRGR